MTTTQKWYIVKDQNSHCHIVPQNKDESFDPALSWGPFTTKEEALSKRVGLIRAGKCQPV